VPPGDPQLSLGQRSEIARDVMYHIGLPVITPPRLEELEAGLPDLVASLHSLSHRPAFRQQLADRLSATQAQQSDGQRSIANDPGFASVVDVVQADLAASGERMIPLLLGLFMAGYTIAHNWGR
jgi:hypothetical protein